MLVTCGKYIIHSVLYFGHALTFYIVYYILQVPLQRRAGLSDVRLFVLF